MFVTNWISTTKIQKISEITNFFRHYFLSRTEVDYVKNRVAAYEDSVLKYNEMVRMAAYKDSVANELRRESNSIKRTIKNYQ